MNSPSENMRRPSRIGIGVRLIIAAASIYLVLQLAEPAEIGKAVGTLSWPAVSLALCLHAVIVLLLAWRWSTIVSAMGSGVGYAIAARVTFVSTVLNLTLPTSVGGDIARVWFGSNHGVSLLKGSAAALLDRGIGLVTLVFLVAASAFILGGAVVELVSIAVLVAGVLGGALLLRRADKLPEHRKLHRFAVAIRTTLYKLPVLLGTHSLSLVAHLLAALIAMVLAQGMGIGLTAWSAVLYFPAVLLTAAIPASIGGWGLRELAAIPALALAGVSADAATAIAFAFGLTQLAAALLGSFLVTLPLLRRRDR